MPRGRSRSRGKRRLLPLVVEAEPVDDGAVVVERNMRGLRLPLCARGVSVPTSTKPKPMARSSRGTRASLSKPAAMPTGLGKSRPEQVWAKRWSSGAVGARIKPELEALDGEFMRPLGSSACEQQLGPGRTARSRERLLRAGRGEPSAASQRLGPQHGGKIERAVKMREQRAAARRLPCKRVPKPSASSARRTRSSCPAKCLASVAAS